MFKSLLKALADPNRLQIIEDLASGERCVCDLMSDLGLARDCRFNSKCSSNVGY